MNIKQARITLLFAILSALFTTQLVYTQDDTSSTCEEQVHIIWESYANGTSDILYANGETITYLTNDPDIYHNFPKLSGTNAVWLSSSNTFGELTYWDGESVQQITNNTLYENYFAIAGEQVAFIGTDSQSTAESVRVWDGGAITQIQISEAEYPPVMYQLAMDESGFAWTEVVTADDWTSARLFYWDGSSVIDLSTGDIDNSHAHISNGWVVWESEDRDYEARNSAIYVWDGTTITQISNGDFRDSNPHTDGERVVWLREIGASTEVMLWDGTTTTQLTDDLFDEAFPKVDGAQVVWVNSNSQVLLWDGNTTIELSASAPIRDADVQMTGNHVVWQQGDDIYYYNGTEAVQLTDSESLDRRPQVSITQDCTDSE